MIISFSELVLQNLTLLSSDMLITMTEGDQLAPTGSPHTYINHVLFTCIFTCRHWQYDGQILCGLSVNEEIPAAGR